MTAETAILGCILHDNRMWRVAAEVIDGNDFENPHLGSVFDGIGRAVVAGETVTMYDLTSRFPGWGVRGIDDADVVGWLVDAPAVAAFALRDQIRAQSVRRQGGELTRWAVGEFGESGSDPEAVLERVAKGVRDITTRQATVGAHTLTDVLAVEDPEEHDWVIPGLLERRDRLILTGHEGAGKTTVTRQLVIAAAAGLHPFHSTGSPYIRPVKSLVVDAENTGRQWRRSASNLVRAGQELGSADPGGNVVLATPGRIDLVKPSTLGWVHRLIDEHKPDLVFIGPLYQVARKSLSDQEDAQDVIAALDTIRERGVALVMEAHAGHSSSISGVRDVRPRGSSVLMGWPEFGFGIRKSSGPDPREFDFVPWRGSREERAWPRQLYRGGNPWPWEPSFYESGYPS